MAALVVYYSRAGENYFAGQYRNLEVGNTEIVAQYIAEALKADSFRIEQKVSYAQDYQTCIKQAQSDLRRQARPALTAFPDNMDQYDAVYLGYPNYWGDLPMAVYTFLEACDWHGKTIHPFCTHEGSGLGQTVEHIRHACKGAEVGKGLAVVGGQVQQCRQTVQQWLNL